MAVKLYEAVVRFPASPQPYDAGYGPSHNVRVKFADPNAPKTNDDGEANIYKKQDSEEARYMLSLKKGDGLQLAYHAGEGGKAGWYEIVIDEMPPASTPQAQQSVPTTTSVSTAIEWKEPDDEYWELWDMALDMESKRFRMAWDMALTTLKKMKMEDASEDIMYRLAVSLYLNASKHAKVGMVKHREPTEVDMDVELLLMLDPDNLVDTLIDAIVDMNDGFYNSVGLKAMLKGFGIVSGDITDQDSALRVAHIARDYADMVRSGADENVAESAIADKYELLAF